MCDNMWSRSFRKPEDRLSRVAAHQMQQLISQHDFTTGNGLMK